MRILFVVEQYVDEGGRYYREFFRHLNELGGSVVVANLCESKRFLEDIGEAIDGYHAFALTGGYYRAIPKLTRIIRKERPTIIQAIETIPAFYAALSLLPIFRSRPTLVYGRRHGPTIGWVQKVMDQIAFAVSSKVIAVSDSMAEVAKAEHPLGKRKVTSILNGISLEAGASQTADERAALDSLRSGTAEYTLLLLARLRKVKGHRIALDAMERLRNRYSGLRMLFVGEGPDREALEEEVVRRGLSDCVVVTGHIEAVQEVLDMSDAMIIPSFAEPQGKVAVEAFAAGVPVVASAVGGLDDMITDRKTGLLVPPGDGEALADAIEELMADRALGKMLADNAGMVYSETLTPEAMVAAYWEEYQDLARGQ